ncbi:hypothetical protein DFH08DRAFT_970390 [Mycena albidolilacea]|uniref:Uncharacterized protein n=1 Tax=Mycena albidolilacea TaxID=1033008 RepID=A0AAD7EFL9_9AGAR|nr:hypothetical protein DFH08DRAFT_970390 [Mycena albidolilacea]
MSPSTTHFPNVPCLPPSPSSSISARAPSFYLVPSRPPHLPPLLLVPPTRAAANPWLSHDRYILGAHPSLRAQWTLYDLLSAVAHVQSSRTSHFAADDSICGCLRHDWCHWCGLATIPSLTHLTLSPSIATEILASVVTDCARLALVVAMGIDGACYVLEETLTMPPPWIYFFYVLCKNGYDTLAPGSRLPFIFEALLAPGTHSAQ